MKIKVFAAAISGRFGQSGENFGDALMEPLLGHLFNREILYTAPGKAELIGVGSILDAYYRRTKTTNMPLYHRRPWRQLHVWGSGFMDANSHATWPQRLRIHAVRGRISRKRLLDVHNNPNLPLGDPALLLPLIWPARGPKKAAVSVIPHFATRQKFRDQYESTLPQHWQIVDLLRPPKEISELIAASDLVISSSLHGLIVADAYGVPSCWMAPTGKIKGDGTKFEDYFSSVGIAKQQLEFDGLLAKPSALPDLATRAAIEDEMVTGLINSFPFR